MGTDSSKPKIVKPEGSVIVSVQHKQSVTIHDCEELQQLKQLSKPVPLRPSSTYSLSQYASASSSSLLNQQQHAHNNNINTGNDKSSLYNNSYISSDPSESTNNLSNKSNKSGSPFNPSLLLSPPSLSSSGMDILYRDLRIHFTSLAVRVDCNQVNCIYLIQEMDEKLAHFRAKMIDIDYTLNQIQKKIQIFKSVNNSIKILNKQLNLAVDRCNKLDKLLSSSPNKDVSILHSGIMIRLGSFLKGNRKRYVILFNDGLMAYYNYISSTNYDNELKGVINLINATEVIPSDINNLMIKIKRNNNRIISWHFKCPTPKDVTKWLNCIKSLFIVNNTISTSITKRQYSILYNNICDNNISCVCLINVPDYIIFSDGYKLSILNSCISFYCDSDILSIEYNNSLSILFFSTISCIRSILLSQIQKCIQLNRNISVNDINIVLNVQNNNNILSIDDLSTSESGNILFICDSLSNCIWSFNLSNQILIKLITISSPQCITQLNNTLYITSKQQCGIYYYEFKTKFTPKFTPKKAKILKIFQNIILNDIVSMKLLPKYHRKSSSTSSLSSSSSPSIQSSILFVCDIESNLYMIRLTDLIIISFGIINNCNCSKIFYCSSKDNLYITQPKNNQIICISKIYNQIISKLNTNNTNNHNQNTNNNSKKKVIIKLNDNNNNRPQCFPSSLYLVYSSSNDNNNNNNNNNDNMNILVEVDNMILCSMLSELRAYSNSRLAYKFHNYSFLYLYTSPYDGISSYRELDVNYESSVPAKNLIQHSSIGSVILIKLKAPTKQQIKKQKEKDAKIKKKSNRKSKKEKSKLKYKHPFLE